MDVVTKITSLFPWLENKNYNKWNRNIWAILRKNKLWQYIQSEFPKADKDNLLSQSQWDDKVIEVAVMMTPIITTGIQAKQTEDEFNDGYKMYWRLKELLQPMGETQVMRLTQEYYTLSYQIFGNISEFFNHIKLLEEQINATKITMAPDKQALLCLTIALRDVKHFQSLVQIWGVTSDMTAEKTQDMLLEDERRQAKKNGNKASNATALAHRNFVHQGQEAGDCRHCHKPGHKEDLCRKKHPGLMPAWAKLKRESQSISNESTSPLKPATMLRNTNRPSQT